MKDSFAKWCRAFSKALLFSVSCLPQDESTLSFCDVQIHMAACSGTRVLITAASYEPTPHRIGLNSIFACVVPRVAA